MIPISIIMAESSKASRQQIEKVKELLYCPVPSCTGCKKLTLAQKEPKVSFHEFSHLQPLNTKSPAPETSESQTAGGWVYPKGASLYDLQYLYSPLCLLHWTLPQAEVLNWMTPWSNLVVLFLGSIFVHTSRYYFILGLNSPTNVFMKTEDKKCIEGTLLGTTVLRKKCT